ncbi:TonB-dependent receptor [Olivibacter sp. SDN3]|uniref:TonB-dependent receptor n=1 Tax=Olivibacter sp. SDN3 TaxID=2764720 RepID=UPI0016511444|nr:TonB-dependent receptor [Olivibacter sp. SDN3]QNL48258.1 TonB-dependent receptor [Olivibacter sp. SDN3]
MQINKILLVGILCAYTFFSFAQGSGLSSIQGRITNKQQEAVEAASIRLLNTGFGTVTSARGFYEITGIPPGNYRLQIRALGYISVVKDFSIKPDEKNVFDVLLEDELNQMDEVSVIGRTANQTANRQAYNITSIDARQLHNTTLDLSHALDRVSGVRVRETGGVGSSFNFSLNGFMGRQVKFFIDGVPMDNFGSSFQINNIPVNLAERVEVYKGVVPISLGADALGGAINIVTNQTHRNYLDVSYSYGSFNTHRSTINAGYTSKSGFTFQLNAFQNYSDNNYKVFVPIVENLLTGYTYNGWARRFHDSYRNETIIANMGLVDKKFADRLLIGITLGQNWADIQTGNRMYDVYGERRRRGSIIMPSVKYSKKDLFVKGLELRLNGNFNFGEEQTIDTAFKQYNWLGDWIYKGADPSQWMAGGERSRTLYKFKNNIGLANAALSYALNERHSLVLNNQFSTFNRKGENELVPEDENARQPRKTQKSITGLAYRWDASSRWNTTVFVKHYYQHNTSFQVIDQIYYQQKNTFDDLGYGLASTYFLLPDLQLKLSYEKSFRLPENEELFGDIVNVDANFNLRPESSHNINFGANYAFTINHNHRLYAEANLINRIAKDFIRPVLSTGTGVAQLRNANLRDVSNLGFDSELRYIYKDKLTAGINVTYQNLRNNTMYEGDANNVSPVYRDRIPNMPFLYGNAYASYTLYNVGKNGNTLSLGYNLLYVHAYYLRWPSQGETNKADIPKQLAHDANAVYSFGAGKYHVALECRNLTDELLYDNFSLQKPSRSFNLKLRYFLNNQ